MSRQQQLPPKYKPLFDAAHKGHLDAFKELLKRHRQEENDPDWSVLAVVYPKSGDGILHVLSRAGHVRLIQELLEQESCQNVRNYEGKTPLHDASQCCRAEVVAALLGAAAAPVDALKQADWTPLMLACTKARNEEVVALLLAHGADPALRNKDGWTPFHLAARK